MIALRRSLLVLFCALFPVAISCNKSSVQPKTADKSGDSDAGQVAKPAPEAPALAPDDAKVLSEIEQTKGVVVVQDGGHVVELDLRKMRASDIKDQENEFAWIAGLPALKTLRAGGPGISTQAVLKLKGHPRLQVIEFASATAVNDEAIAVIAQLPALVDVDLSKSEITDAGLALLADCPTLRRIRIARTKVTDAGIAHLEKAAGRLELLDLLECSLLTNQCASSVGKMTRMRNVRLPNSVDDSGLAQLQSLRSLVALGLQYCRVGAEGIKHIEGLKEIKELNLYGAAGVDDSAIDSLAKLPKLEKLRLRETAVRGEAASGFAKMQALRDLDLSESPVQNAVMEHLASLPRLTNLNLWNTQINAQGLAVLKGKTTLKQLNLQNLGDSIDDDFLDTIATLPNLEVLVLQGTGVTDEGMPKLYGLKKLKQLAIQSTYVLEKSSVEKLKAELPGATIQW